MSKIHTHSIYIHVCIHNTTHNTTTDIITSTNLSHSTVYAYTIQCSGNLGVSAIVHIGNVCCGGNESIEHSKHDVIVGIMTLDWPLRPSVPPSIKGIMVDGSGSPSVSYSTRPTSKELSHRRASILSIHSVICITYECI